MSNTWPEFERASECPECSGVDTWIASKDRTAYCYDCDHMWKPDNSDSTNDA